MIITISADTVPNYRYGGSTATIRVFANQTFNASTGTRIQQGIIPNGWYKQISCTVSGSTLSIPSFTIDSTTDSSDRDASYTFIVYDENGVRREPLYINYKIPTSFGTTVSWANLSTYNRARQPLYRRGYYTDAQVNELLAQYTSTAQKQSDSLIGVGKLDTAPDDAQNPIAVGANNKVFLAIQETKYLDQYDGLAAAVTDIGSTPTELKITSNEVVSSNLTLPATLVLTFEGNGKIETDNADVVIGAMTPTGTRQIFDTSGGGTVTFAKNAVSEMNLSWWAGVSNTSDLTDIFAQVETSLTNNGGGILRIGMGAWKGAITLPSGSNIIGAGSGVGTSNATVLKPADSSSAHIIKAEEAFRNIVIENLTLSADTNTGTHCLLLEGTYPNSAAGFECRNVTFHGTGTGSAAQVYVKDLANDWELINLHFNHCTWVVPTNGVGYRCDSVNNSAKFTQPFFYIGVGATANYLEHFGDLTYDTPTINGVNTLASTATLDREIAQATVASGTKNVTIQSPDALTQNDIGQQIIFDGGFTSHITGITSATACTIEDNAPSTFTNKAMEVYRYTPSSSMSGKAFHVTDSHGTLTIVNPQDEGLQYFLVNAGSQLTYPITIIGGFIQSIINLEQSCTLNFIGSDFYSQTFTDGASAAARIALVGCSLRNTGLNFKPTSVVGVELLEPRLWNARSGASIVQTELIYTESSLTQGIGIPTEIKHGEVFASNPERTKPVFGVYSSSVSSGGVTKPQIRFGRLSPVTEKPDFYYDLYRDYDSGRAKLTGNQSGFVGFDFNGDISAVNFRGAELEVSLSANQNNWTPSTLAQNLLVTTDAERTITGMTFSIAQNGGDVRTIQNVGSNNLVIAHQSGSSSSGNRFLNSTSGDITLPPNGIAYCVYDGTTRRWRTFTTAQFQQANSVLTGLQSVTATATEINQLNDVSAYTETIAGAGALSVTKVVSKLALSGAGAVTLAAPDASMLGQIKTIEMTSDAGDVTLALTNIVGQSSGTTCTFNDVGDALVLLALSTKWVVIKEYGVTLS